jgi:type IV pilus assembly protein PilQ
MKMINRALLAATACLVLILPARAQGANAIEAVNVAPQGNDIAVRIDLREPLAAPPAAFSVTNPPKIALDFPATSNALGKTTQMINEWCNSGSATGSAPGGCVHRPERH